MLDTIKVRISNFVFIILENDAIRFGFYKNQKPNKNALLNKLIPVLVELRKTKRSKIKEVLQNEFNRTDYENIYNVVNMVIDKVYFNDEELSILDEQIWIRPTKENISTFDEIKHSETQITAQDLSVYIRGLLNEYARLPQYKREELVFDKELDIMYSATQTGQIVHFTEKSTQIKYKAFAFNCFYGFTTDQTNYIIIYDIINQEIKSIPIYEIENAYIIKQKYKPSDVLIKQLNEYNYSYEFDKIIKIKND